MLDYSFLCCCLFVICSLICLSVFVIWWSKPLLKVRLSSWWALALAHCGYCRYYIQVQSQLLNLAPPWALQPGVSKYQICTAHKPFYTLVTGLGSSVDFCQQRRFPFHHQLKSAVRLTLCQRYFRILLCQAHLFGDTQSQCVGLFLG